MAAAQFDLGQFHGFVDHGQHFRRCAVRLAALYEGANALNDLSGALGLVCGFLQGPEHVFFFNVLVANARDQAIAVVADGGQRLVQFVCHAGRHLAHGDQAAGRMGAFGLLGGEFFGLAAGGDVGGNHHLSQSTIGPVDVA